MKENRLRSFYLLFLRLLQKGKSQLIFTFSKSPIETLEKGVTYFTSFSSVSIIDFEQVTVSWVSI